MVDTDESDVVQHSSMNLPKVSESLLYSLIASRTDLAWRMGSNEDHCNLVSHYFKKTEKFAEVTVERLVEENGYYDPLFAVIGKKGELKIVE